ncbi:Putative oligoketide cyclase/dehydratase or lipid transport protein YfjG [Bathymodiolus thermophilus thioautotrophic gill symbiont]|uniref:Oligoketide cyclase/lipid transport protein n=4 Tax=Gammaproteobacteria incertae sedis TaxID=118884 RepID=A0A1H6J8Q1_9GAMM|nr:Putative oligoketide cyclase/dehydratase or lipid transport protein YfjG [Bathymodiolus thermophilus thioautotrophic gill symbiont]CAB5503184.1 Putative oligoketide cyclase/dehydratase or lipid transport protein YfjG [Bathymodiolus azoricus thioautotrophic gill symbiont]SEH58431.1 oligoketide cyclase/lipid transport protein [Bathymodiolus azoricus thioautotrophic gill symbiont]SEH97106.1 oligoketide cyclase/lipid transport protein [Bathymodiolus azoricus thioautotrophic gill symbiont]VVH5651
MYQLVNQIDKYPQFLNWCSSADILNQTEQEITASVSINKNTFKQTFTTLNTLTPNVRIDMQLKDGPFKQLNGAWIFTSLNDNACKINLELEFSFASKLVDMVITPVFTSISNTQLDAFIERAKQIYG